MRRLLTHPLSAPRTGFHDARIIPVGDPQSVMELYGSDDGFLRDSGRTRRGPPKALRASDVLGDDTRPFGAFDAADTRSERGPMARAETPGAPILKIDPQDRKKVKGVKAGARARTRPRRARPSLKFSQILPSPPRACLSSRGPNLPFSQHFPPFCPTNVTRVPSPSIAACHKFINLEETRPLADSVQIKQIKQASTRSVGKKACAAAAGSTSEVARGDAIRVKAFRGGSWHGGNHAGSLLKVAGLFRCKSEQNIRVIIEQHSAKGVPCSITATLDSIDGGFTPAQLESGDLGVKLECGAVDSTEPAPVPSMSRMPSHLANTTSREGSEGSSGPTPPPRARRGKEKQRSNLTRALPADDPLDSPRINAALFPRSAVSRGPACPKEPRGHFDVTVKMVGTMDEHPAYSSEKERMLSLEHARRLGRYLAERTIEGTLEEAEQIYGKTSQMWKEAGSVVEERDGLPRHFPPREEHQPPCIQVCIRGNPDANFDAVGEGCDDKIRRLCTDGVVGVPAEDEGDIHGSGRSTAVAEPPPPQTYFRDAMDDLDFLLPDVLLDAGLHQHESMPP